MFEELWSMIAVIPPEMWKSWFSSGKGHNFILNKFRFYKGFNFFWLPHRNIFSFSKDELVLIFPP